MNVSLNGNLLSISGKREEEHEEERENYYAMERSYGAFARHFTLPDGVDAEDVADAHPLLASDAVGALRRDARGRRRG